MVTEELLDSFFDHCTTAEENEAIYNWVSESKENEQAFNNALKFNLLLQEISITADTVTQKKTVKAKRNRIWRPFIYAVGVAASLAIGAFFSFRYLDIKYIDEASRLMTFATGNGQRVDITLPDGTTVCLNSGSTLSYPALFTGDLRKVSLEGEAMFDVRHNPQQPFIVETFGYDVKVHGTKFDVVADSESREFCTSLLEGKVTVTDRSTRHGIVLAPNQKVYAENGILKRENVTNLDETSLWTEGVLSIASLSFREVVSRLERCYGVDIEVDCHEEPAFGYSFLKLRISDGIAHAFEMLEMGSNFKVSYNEKENRYRIAN
ncbi:MAG: FecR domain-containing protein [Bacteroidales bacterium]|nr:FecR domain-containing protein [Bacteroidales bacterium]